jgi:hypothetical protein
MVLLLHCQHPRSHHLCRTPPDPSTAPRCAPQCIWQTNQGVSQLRVKFMSQVPKGGPTHTVMVTDLPGLKYGTLLDRVGGQEGRRARSCCCCCCCCRMLHVLHHRAEAAPARCR